MTASLRQILIERLAPALRPGGYALIDYPLYNNPGDALIWAGSRQLIEAASGRAPDYVSTLRGFDPAACRAAIGEGTVYFLGGGNFGDLYQKHHGYRLRALRALAGLRVVLLPLSLACTAAPAEALITETAAALRIPAEVQAFARDRKTAEGLAGLGLTPVLVPDAAHMLELCAGAPEQPVSRLIRQDREAVGRTQPGWDWPDVPELRWLNRWGRLAAGLTPARHRLALYDRLAGRRISMAIRRLGAADRVETDRLHGLILAQLIGRPVQLADHVPDKLLDYVSLWGDGLTMLCPKEIASCP